MQFYRRDNHSSDNKVILNSGRVTRPLFSAVVTLGAVLVVMLGVAPVLSQTPPPTFEVSPADSVLDRKNYDVRQQKRMLPPAQTVRLQTARSQMKSGDYAGAADLLELIYRDYPLDPRVVNLLKECYIEQKRYFSAIEILQRQSLAEPGNLNPLLDIADVYFKWDRKDSALSYVDFAFSIPRDSADVRVKQHHLRRGLNMLIDNWQDSLALDYAHWLRGTAGDSALFRDLVSDALERRRDYAGAMHELFAMVAEDTTTAAVRRKTGDRKLAQLFNYPEAQPVIRDELERMLSEQPSDTVALRYLGELYMRTHEYDRAFDLYVRYDSLSQNTGRYLLYYLRECFDRKLYEQSMRMGDYILSERPHSPIAGATRFFQARALTATQNYRGAIDVYREALASDPSRSGQAEAAYEIGELYLEELNEPDSAFVMFNQALSKVNSGPIAWKCAFGLMRIELIDGDISAAERRLARLLDQPLSDEDAERALYQLARIALITSDLDSANASFTRVIERYPRGFYVNDALSAMMVLQQGAEASPDLLELYSKSELYRERRMRDSLQATLLALVEHEDTTLADVALLDLGRIALEDSDTARALEYISDVNIRYPESYFAPHAEKLKADIYYANPERRDAALAIYRALLKDYSSYPFAAEVREILRAEGQNPDEIKKGKEKRDPSDA